MRRRRIRNTSAALATGALLAAVLSAAPPAAGTPPERRVPGTQLLVESVRTAQAPDGWQVTLRTHARVPLRDDLPVLVADGRVLGLARGSADGRTFQVTTATPPTGEVTLGWSTSATSATSATARGQGDPGQDPDPPEPTGAPSPWLAVDPGAPGGHGVTERDYDLGDEALDLPALGHRSELRARAYLPSGARGARPLVVLLHGRHSVCYDPNDQGAGGEVPWPCGPGLRAVPSYRGYAQTARALAGQGYAVVSLSANAVNAWDFDTLDAGQSARAELVLAHLDLLRRWQSRGTGPLAATRLDFSRVGLMGHSRGGEGVARAYALNESRGAPYGIRALFLLAPTDFARATTPDVATAVLLPYCDGDVFDLQGQHFYDDTRYALAGDGALRSSLLMMGANHNFFNAEWTPGMSQAPSFDDWGGEPAKPCGSEHPGRLTAAEQQSAGRAWTAGFFRATLGGETRLLPLFDGSGTRPRSAPRALVHATYQAPAEARRDVARLDGSLPRGTTAVGLAATACSGTSGWMPGDYPPPPRTPLPPCSDVHPFLSAHWTPSFLAPATPGTAFLRVAWTRRGGSVRFPLPDADVRRFDALTLRAAPGADTETDLTVRVRDATGRHADVSVSSVSPALRRLPSLARGLRHLQLRTVRIPLRLLGGVDLRRVRSVELVADRTPTGAALVGDVAFQSAAASAAGRGTLPVLTLGGRLAVPEGDAGTRTVRLPVRLSRPVPYPVTVQLGATPLAFFFERAAAPVVEDYGRRVTIPAGTVRTSLPVRVTGNTTYGVSVDVLTAASAPTGALLGSSLVLGVVREDDQPPAVRLSSASAVEGGRLRFGVTLSRRSDFFTTLRLALVDGTATQGSDYAVPGHEPGTELLLHVEPGETSATLDVDALADDRTEGTETFRLRVLEVFEGTLAGPRSVVGEITDP